MMKLRETNNQALLTSAAHRTRRLIQASAMVNQNKHIDSFSNVSWVDIGEGQHGQRIDNFLFKHLKGVPKSRVYRILRKGEVRVNKGRVQPSYKLQTGDKLRIPPIRTAQLNSDELIVPAWVTAAIDKPIYEDEVLFVINKPAGLAVHGGSGIAFGLIEAVRKLRPQASFMELVHRIDRETSGCIILAKTRPALNKLHQQFRREEGQLQKSYLSVLSGQLSEVKTVTAALQQTRDDKGMKRVMVDSAGQKAKSTFMPITAFGGVASYVRIQLYTGRMHQARVHAASIGLPILGDKIYGNWEVNRKMQKQSVSRCLLHAERYQLEHPETGKQLQLIAPLPQEFSRVLENLQGIDAL